MPFPTIIFLQAMYYAIVMLLTLFIIGVLLKGFLWNYFRVRTSFGRLVLVKVRTPLRDYFLRGWVDEGFLIYKKGKEELRLSLSQTKKPFYKCMSVIWIDIDEERGAICETDYKAVEGFDPVKFSDFIKRALMRPVAGDNKEKVIIIILIVTLIISCLSLYLAYTNGLQISQLSELPKLVAEQIGGLKGTIVGSTNI